MLLLISPSFKISMTGDFSFYADVLGQAHLDSGVPGACFHEWNGKCSLEEYTNTFLNETHQAILNDVQKR